MNKPVWLGRLLSVGGILETVAGLGLLVDPPGGVMVLLRSSLEAPGIVLGRIVGGGLLSLGIACWCARKTPSAPASRGVAWGFLAYNVVISVTLVWAGIPLGSGALPALSAAALHGALGAALLGALFGRGQASVGS